MLAAEVSSSGSSDNGGELCKKNIGEDVPKPPIYTLQISAREQNAQRPSVMDKQSPPSPMQFTGNIHLKTGNILSRDL